MAPGWKVWNAGCCWVSLPAGLLQGYAKVLPGFAHILSPEMEVMGFCIPPRQTLSHLHSLCHQKAFPSAKP